MTTSLVAIALVFGLVGIAFVLLPFVKGKGGLLLDAAGGDSPERLRARQDALLERWLVDEASAQSGMITAREWSMRQVYLTNRFVDSTRRLDWLNRGGTSK